MTASMFDELGPSGRRRATIATSVGALVVLGAVTYAGLSLSGKGMFAPEIWGVFWQEPDLIGLLVDGILSTLQAAFVALVLSVAVGGVLASALLSDNKSLRIGVRCWMELFRGLPVLLIIFFIYLGAPVFGLSIPAFWSLVLGLMLYNSAVVAEIFRAGIATLPKGQGEAGLAIGLTTGQVFRIIELPQAARRMLPSLISQCVIILKETSLGFIIGYVELLREGRTAVEYLGGQYSFAIYTVLALIYICLNLSLSTIARLIDARS
jgi:glutamate transport system permease protein